MRTRGVVGVWVGRAVAVVRAVVVAAAVAAIGAVGGGAATVSGAQEVASMVAAAPVTAEAAGVAGAASAQAEAVAGGEVAAGAGGAPAAVAGGEKGEESGKEGAAGPAGERWRVDGEVLARRYRKSGEAVAIERQGEVLVPFGHGRAVVRCAPLRACAVELEAGEAVLATSSGDSERWLIQTAAAGSGGRTPLVVVKPTACDLATNLLIATDRRVYELALEAPPCAAGRGAAAEGGEGEGRGSYNPRLPYTGLLRFYYPDELVRRWEGEAAAAARQAEREAVGRTEIGPAARLAQLNFDYEWPRDKGFAWTPRQVFDDGERTYVVVPVAARWAAAPALFELQADGSTALLNYRLEGDTYVAERVVARAVLVAPGGHGRAPERLEIRNLRLGRAGRPR